MSGLLPIALSIDITPGWATVVAAFFVCISSLWQTWMLSKVHTLVNSNYSESVNAKVAAEVALKVAQEMNRQLQQQLDTLKLHTVLPSLIQPFTQPTEPHPPRRDDVPK